MIPGRLRQEDEANETSMSYIVRTCLKKEEMGGRIFAIPFYSYKDLKESGVKIKIRN